MKSPLYVAARDGDVGRVRALVDAGADVNCGGDGLYDLLTPLLVATRREHRDMMRLLLLHGGHLGDLFPFGCAHVTACTHRMAEQLGRLLRAGPRLCTWRRACRALTIVIYWRKLLRPR